MTDLRSNHDSRRRHIIASVAGGLLLLGSLAAVAAEQPGGTERKTATIPVQGMACVSCAATVKRAVKTVDGVSDVEVSLAARSVRFTYAPAVASPERIADTINSLGYKAGAPVETK